MTTQIIASASVAALATVLPLVQGRKSSWLERLLNRAKPKQIVATPPSIINDAGWNLVHSEDLESFKEWLGKDSEGLPFAPGEMPSLGSHVLIELFGCDHASLELEKSVGTAMRDAAQETKKQKLE